MSGRSSDPLIVQLVNTPNFWKGRVNTSLAMSGILAGTVGILGAAARFAVSGGGHFFAPMLLAAGTIGLLVLYGYLRFWNATVFVRRGRVGVTNWLGLSRSVPVDAVDHLHRTAEVRTGEQRPRGVLFIATKNPRQSLRFAGGDRLEPGGLERVATAIGVPIEGTWADLPTWQPR